MEITTWEALRCLAEMSAGINLMRAVWSDLSVGGERKQAAVGESSSNSRPNIFRGGFNADFNDGHKMFYSFAGVSMA